MVKLECLSAGYRRREIISNINLLCPSGTVTTIIGSNGCGKSTLLKSIAGLCDVYAGEVLLNDKAKSEMSERELAKKVAYLSQTHDTPVITVERLVLHGRFPHLSYPRHYSKEDILLCSQVMKEIGILELKNKKMSELSGGQRQKVYLAMALVRGTDILLFDEPATYLDIQYQLELLKIMNQMKQQKKTLISVMHDIDQAMQISDQIVLMNSGNIEKAGTPEEIYQSGKLDALFHIKINKVQDVNNRTHYIVV